MSNFQQIIILLANITHIFNYFLALLDLVSNREMLSHTQKHRESVSRAFLQPRQAGDVLEKGLIVFIKSQKKLGEIDESMYRLPTKPWESLKAVTMVVSH